MDRAALIDRAGHELVGRGVVVSLSDGTKPRYASREEMKERMAEAQVEPGLLAGVLFARDKYDPEWQAVLLVETPECCTVTIAGHQGSEAVGSVSFTTTH